MLVVEPAPVPEQSSATEPDASAGIGVLRLAAGKWICQALGIAAELGIADQLAEGPLSVAELAARTGSDEDALHRLLRALAAVGVFEQPGVRTFRNNAESSAMRSDAPGSVRGMVRWLAEGAAWDAWKELRYSVRTGKPAFDHVFGQQVFQYFAKNRESAELFNAGMTSLSRIEGAAVARAYDFSPFERIVDVGGGHGALLLAIAERFAGFTGVLYDRPEIVAGSPAVLSTHPHGRRIEVAAGDFLEAVPAGADAYLLKHIIHDWDDERSVGILSRCREAMRPGGTLLVIDQLVSDAPHAHFSKLMDLEMLVMTPGGRERTEAEFTALFEQAGLRLTRVVQTDGAVAVIEAAAAPGTVH